MQGWSKQAFWDKYNSNTIISNWNSRNTITIPYNQSICLSNTISTQFQPFKSYIKTIHNTIHTQYQFSNINIEWKIYLTIISRTQYYNLCWHGICHYKYAEWVLSFWTQKRGKTWNCYIILNNWKGSYYSVVVS